MDDILFNDDIPGWSGYEETKIVVNIIKHYEIDYDTSIKSIIDIGSLYGRMTWALDNNFPSASVTGVEPFDHYNYIEAHSRVRKLYGDPVTDFNIEPTFKKYNDCAIVDGLLEDITDNYDVVVLGLESSSVNNEIWKHANRISNKMVIGVRIEEDILPDYSIIVLQNPELGGNTTKKLVYYTQENI